MHCRNRIVHAAALAVILLAALVPIGCRSTTASGLPRHIRTVEVHIFQNKTMYNSIEAWVTRDIIDRINADPVVRVTSRNGDALITGEILAVNRRTLRETTINEPGTVLITIDARFSFSDTIELRSIIEDMRVRSTETGMSPGIYEASRDESSEEGQRGAAKQIAAEIVRRTIGMW
ncbi:MAG: LPS assembly lipoprotein LptE [Planctomycetes bacterium]|nr:LPS assembly lipoprotein LptE [Planctomycetota bacterium]